MIGPASAGGQAAFGDEAQDGVEGVIRHDRPPRPRAAASRRVASSTSISPRSRSRRMARLGSTGASRRSRRRRRRSSGGGMSGISGSGARVAVPAPRASDGAERRGPDDAQVAGGGAEGRRLHRRRPTTTVRRPRGPSDRASTSAGTSPVIDEASTRRPLAGARVASPLTVSMAYGPSPSNARRRAGHRRSSPPESREIDPARMARSPDTVRALTSAGAAARMATSPETASMVSRPPTSCNVDVARRGPVALLAAQPDGREVGAGAFDDDRRGDRDLDVEIGGRHRGRGRRGSRRRAPCPGDADRCRRERGCERCRPARPADGCRCCGLRG